MRSPASNTLPRGRLTDTTGQIELLTPRSALLAQNQHFVTGLFLSQISDYPGHSETLPLADHDARRQCSTSRLPIVRDGTLDAPL